MKRQNKLPRFLVLVVPVALIVIVFFPHGPVGQSRTPRFTHTPSSLGASHDDSSKGLPDLVWRQAAGCSLCASTVARQAVASAETTDSRTKALQKEIPSQRRLEREAQVTDIARIVSETVWDVGSALRDDKLSTDPPEAPLSSHETDADSAQANVSGTIRLPTLSSDTLVRPFYWAGSFVLVGGAPVHEWIAFQGYNRLPSGSALKQEMSAYLPTDANSAWYAEDFPLQLPHEIVNLVMYKPTAWSGCGVGQSATALIEGTFEEDEPSCYIGPDSSNSHYWNPDGGYNAGLGSANSALFDAQDRFARALANYPANKAAAYYWLGRTAHLLADMSVPAHTLLDAHGFPDFDSYEYYTASGNNYQAINSSQGITDPPQSLPSEYLTQGDVQLTELFYTLAKKSKEFDSDDVNGTSPVTGQGQFNAGGTISDYTLSVLHQPLLESRAIGYSAALYTLFWERTHPPITIALTGSNVVLSWPTNVPGFTVEFTTNIPATGWASNSTAPAIVDGLYTVSDTISGPARFYRLKR